MPGEFTQMDLATDDVMILDAGDQVHSFLITTQSLVYFLIFLGYLEIAPAGVFPTSSIFGLEMMLMRRRELEHPGLVREHG